MAVPTRQDRAGHDGELETTARAVTAHRTSPDRTVFTERDNTDGWIATDLTVELEP